jgi:hypothetical protein
MKMKDFETIVEDLFYLMTEGRKYDVEYREREVDLEKKLGDLYRSKGISTPFDSYMKDVLENIEDVEESYMVRDVKQSRTLIEIENAIDEREMQAIRIACRAGIACGISLCKNRGLNIQR